MSYQDDFMALIERAKVHIRERRAAIAASGNHSWEWDGKRAWGILCELADIELPPECDCEGGPQGEGCVSLPHESSCPVYAWERRPT